MAGSPVNTGNDILLYVYVGNSPQPIAYQTEHSHESSREGIDVSHKGSDHAQVVPGREEGTISLSLKRLKPNSPHATHTTLRDAYDKKLPVTVQEVETFPGAAANGSENAVREAEGYILSYSSEAPDNDAATYELEITLIEPLTALPFVAPVKASLGIGAGNAGVRYVADLAGVGGNSIRVAHVNPGAASPLSVAVLGNDITVTLAHSGTALTSTASQVAAAVNGNAAAAALVDASLIGDGTGIAVAQALSALAGGA